MKVALGAAALVVVLGARCGADADPGTPCATDSDCPGLVCDVGECRSRSSDSVRPATLATSDRPVANLRGLTERFQIPIGARVVANPILLPDGNALIVALDGRVLVVRSDGSTARDVRLGVEVRSSPAVDVSGRIAIGAIDGTVRILDATLTEVARVPGFAPIEGPIVALRNGTFAVPTRGLALMTNRGALVGRVDAATVVRGGAAGHPDGRVILATTEGELLGVDVRGNVSFRTRIGANSDGIPTVLPDGTIVVGTDLAELVRVDPAGTILGRATAALDFRGSAVVRPDGTIVAASMDGIVHIYDASLREISSVALPHGVVATPVVASDGSTIIATTGGTLHTLDAAGTLVSVVSIGTPIVTSPLLLRTGTVLVASDDGLVRGLR